MSRELTLFETVELDRASKDMFILDYCKQLNISPNTYYHIKMAKPQIRTYVKLANEMGTDIKTLMLLPISN